MQDLKIKKKFLSEEVINYFDNQIDAAESAVAAEQARAEAQESLIRSEFENADILLDDKIDDSVDLLNGSIESLRADYEEDLAVTASDLVSQMNSKDEATLSSAQDYTDGEIDALSQALDSNINDEVQNRIAGDLALDSKIETEKSRIDSILLASQADKDTFAEIVALINSVDTENDQAFASYVLSNDAALASEVSARQSGDASTLSESKAYTDQKISEIPSVDLSSYETIVNVDSKDAAKLVEAKAYADSKSSAEQSARELAVSDLQSQLDDLDGYAQDIRGDVDGHETRIAALEAQTDGPAFDNELKEVGAELGFVELSRQIKKVMSCAVGRLAVHEGKDFDVSVVGGKTRLTWKGSLLSPTGAESIETGDEVFVVYAY